MKIKWTLLSGLFLFVQNASAGKLENYAEQSWRESFASSYCAQQYLSVKCVSNLTSALCETAPVGNSGSCSELLEIVAFVPESKSTTGQLVVIGKWHPTR